MNNRLVLASLNLLAATSIILPFILQTPSAKAESEAFPSQQTTDSLDTPVSINRLFENSSDRLPDSLIAREDYLFVRSLSGETIQLQGGQPHPLMLKLDQPLRNYSGEVIVPAGVDVLAQVTEMDNGRAEITAEIILIQGMAIELQAVSSPLLIEAEADSIATRNTQSFNTVYGSSLGLVGDIVAGNDHNLNMLFDAVVPLVGNLFSQTEFTRKVTIEPEQSILLAIEERIIVPVEIAQAIQEILTADSNPATATNTEPAQATSDSPETTQLLPETTQPEAEAVDDLSDALTVSNALDEISLCLPVSACEDQEFSLEVVPD